MFWKTVIDNLRQPSSLGYWAVPRILLGYHFLRAASGKLSGNFLAGNALPNQFERLAVDPVALHRAFIEGVVQQYPLFFSYLVAFGELAIGLSLLTGCLVRVSSCFGAFHNLNIYLAIGYPAGGAQMNLNRLFIFLHIVFVLVAAGRPLGIDGFLHKKFPNSRMF